MTTVTANGHQLVPLAMPLRQRGDVSALPQQNDPGQSRTPAAGPGRLARAISAFRRNWWRLVFAAVAAVAAVVSYGHIVSLFLSWHATPLDAHLMPVAIDGLIIIGAGAAKGGQKRLGWSAIGPGLAASLYANVMNGLPYGRGAAMGSGWATVALFLATNVMERWKAAPLSAPAVQPSRDKPEGRLPDKPAGKPVDNGQVVDKPAPRRTAVDSRTAMDKAAAAIRDNPHLDKAELARIAGVSAKTIQRARNSKTGSPA